jgi:hypothetical protein
MEDLHANAYAFTIGQVMSASIYDVLNHHIISRGHLWCFYISFERQPGLDRLGLDIADKIEVDIYTTLAHSVLVEVTRHGEKVRPDIVLQMYAMFPRCLVSF